MPPHYSRQAWGPVGTLAFGWGSQNEAFFTFLKSSRLKIACFENAKYLYDPNLCNIT